MSGTTPRPRIGHPAPDFTLSSTGGGDVTLSAFRGETNVLLAFFPLAFTGVCTTEMRDFSQDLDRFARADTTVFGISVDSVPALAEFKRQHGISVDLLSDFKRKVSRRYGVLLEEHFFAQRAYFIVGKDGNLDWMHVEEDLGHKRDNGELLERLARLR